MSALPSRVPVDEDLRRSSVEGAATPQKLTLRVVRDLEQLRELKPAWNSLLSEYPPASTFSTPEWLISWWQSFGKGKQLFVLTWVDSSSRLIGLAPLLISRERVSLLASLRVVRLLGDGSNDSDNLDLLIRPGFEKEFARAVVEFLSENREWDVCLFNTMPADSLMSGPITDTLRSSRWKYFEHERECSSIALPESWDEYLLQLSTEDRNNLHRYTRRLHKRHSARVYRCSRVDELPFCLNALFRLHQLRWQKAGEPGSFGSAERRDFYADLSRSLLARRQLELWALEVDGEIAAVQFGFRCGRKVFQLQEGYDPDRTTDRVGFILRGEVLKQLIAEGVRVYDFLGGADPYKVRWGARSGTYTDMHFARPFSLGGTWLWVLNSASGVKRSLRARLPRSAWNALHGIHKLVRPSLNRKGSSNQASLGNRL